MRRTIAVLKTRVEALEPFESRWETGKQSLVDSQEEAASLAQEMDTARQQSELEIKKLHEELARIRIEYTNLYNNARQEGLVGHCRHRRGKFGWR